MRIVGKDVCRKLLQAYLALSGGMAERFNALAWKAGVGENRPRVQISFPPLSAGWKSYLLCSEHSEQGKIKKQKFTIIIYDNI